jgi:hypothetical protein
MLRCGHWRDLFGLRKYGLLIFIFGCKLINFLILKINVAFMERVIILLE